MITSPANSPVSARDGQGPEGIGHPHTPGGTNDISQRLLVRLTMVVGALYVLRNWRAVTLLYSVLLGSEHVRVERATMMGRIAEPPAFQVLNVMFLVLAAWITVRAWRARNHDGVALDRRHPACAMFVLLAASWGIEFVWGLWAMVERGLGGMGAIGAMGR